MTFTDLWNRIARMRSAELRATIDAAESVVCGSTHREAERLAGEVIAIVRVLHPELLHSNS